MLLCLLCGLKCAEGGCSFLIYMNPWPQLSPPSLLMPLDRSNWNHFWLELFQMDPPAELQGSGVSALKQQTTAQLVQNITVIHPVINSSSVILCQGLKTVRWCTSIKLAKRPFRLPGEGKKIILFCKSPSRCSFMREWLNAVEANEVSKLTWGLFTSKWRRHVFKTVTFT